jgi:polyhydroxybutyrate depolymerase
MALRLAIERPRLVAAVAAIAAAMPAKSECVAPSAFVPVVFISGTDDPIMPYAGGMVGFGGMNRGSVLSTPDSAGVWVSLGKLPSAPNSLQLPNLDRRDRTRVTRLTYRQADGRPGVVLYRVEGGDHGIPSRLPRTDGESPARWLARAGGRPNGDIESADEIAAFFAAVSR